MIIDGLKIVRRPAKPNQPTAWQLQAMAAPEAYNPWDYQPRAAGGYWSSGRIGLFSAAACRVSRKVLMRKVLGDQ